MKCRSLILLLLSFALSSFAQSFKGTYHFSTLAYVQQKNFRLLWLLQQNESVRSLLENDTLLRKMAAAQNETIEDSLESAKNFRGITGTLKLSEHTVSAGGEHLMALYARSAALQKLVKEQLIPSGAYIRYKALRPDSVLLMAWEQDAADINHTIAVYAEGAKPNSPDIDSISFNIYSPGYLATVQQATKQVSIGAGYSHLFFMPAMTAALTFLNINGRDNAGSYEPMELTVNRAALDYAKKVAWNNYRYTVLLVPGEGPDSSGVAISKGSMIRCRLAAAIYRQGLAPFIMVSGGKVHPYKTPYCEAEQMKKYLIGQLQIPDSAILLEPHARHTTTNMRNAARLFIRYKFPLGQPALVVTDQLQSAYIRHMAQRCIESLGDVPYKLGKRISPTSQEFYALPVALQINPTEPLDP